MKKNLLVAQSGGPTAVINSSLAGVIRGGIENSDLVGEIYGSLNGIEGVENDRIISLEHFRDADRLALLMQTPSSYLGSCRKKLPTAEEDGEFYSRIMSVLKKHNIGYFFYIGGNDSMDTADKLSRYAADIGDDIRIVGIPKTIDNDLAVTDHTPGYGSAAKFVANSLRQLTLDTGVYKMKSVIVLEIMGRNAGWLAAAAALANDSTLRAADIICLPEVTFEPEKLLEKVETVSKSQKTVMLAVSEGIKGADGSYVAENKLKAFGRDDKFAHAVLGGVGRTVEAMIAAELGLKTRTIELSTLQRCWAAGASLCDVNEAFEAGRRGVEFAVRDGLTCVMPCFKRISDDPYKMEIVPLDVNLAANLEKKVPKSMIAADGFGVTEEFIKYASPLIAGEPVPIYKNGVMQFERL